jgi:4-hydroxy-3-polyprenylbenzoate decarboxylase
MHNAGEVLFRLCVNTDPPPLRYGAASPQRACCAGAGRRRDSIFIPQSRDSSDVLDHATSEIASGSKLGIDATKKILGEGFKRPGPSLIKMDAAVKANVEKLFGGIV